MIASPNATKPLQRRVLIVDDHPDMAAMLARTISQVEPRLQVLSSNGGKEALEQVGDLTVDLLITDLMMPEIDGLELIERLRERSVGPPSFIVLITAYDVADLDDKARRLKVDETILKPFPPGLLVQIVRKALNQLDTSRPSRPEHLPTMQ
ncbi:MAG TPA: response regulator [Anaerolineales bacterium]|nr:response regulator [Anaerolineales bacterium]